MSHKLLNQTLRNAQNKSALFTYAAAVEKNDKVTIIFGKSGSGKSTLL
jgi:ABC-type lipoprotein export system ATPase subunit